MKKTSIWLTYDEDEALNRLARERSRTRSHVIRMAIRREAGLEDAAIRRTVRGGWDTGRGVWMFSAMEELVLHIRREGRSAQEIADELRLPLGGVEDIIAGIERKLLYYGDGYDD